MNQEGAHGSISNVDFASLKLRAGGWLQLQSISGATQKLDVEFAGVLHGKSIFVAMAESKAGNAAIKVGERFTVRGFNGVSDFAFNSEVLEIQVQPFVHALLSYPEAVESKVVREAVRIKTSLPAVVKLDGAANPVSVSVADLSAVGALIESAMPLGSVGERIEITIPAQFEKKEADLKMFAEIRHQEKYNSSAAFRSGIEFVDVSKTDKLVLYYLLFRLVENER